MQALDELRTPRLVLRAPTRRDAKPIHAAIQETLDDLIPWLPWAHPDYSLLDTRHFLAVARRMRRRGLSFDYVMQAQADGTIFGMISLHRIDWLRHSAGLGYWVRRSAWNRGIATEAGRGLIEAGFRSYGLHRIEAHVAPQNRVSQSVVEKLGLKREGIARGLESLNGEFVDHIQYAILGPDFVGSEL